MNKNLINKLIIIALCLGGLFYSEARAQYYGRERDSGVPAVNVNTGGGENMDSPFGVLEFLNWNDSWNNYKYPSKENIDRVVSLMNEAGVAWVRTDFLWADIEPKQGEFDFKKYDEIVDILGKHNLKILGILNYSAGWASSDWNVPPKDNKLFVNYAVKVIEHFKDKIKYWEIWNEPDSAIYWAGQDRLKGYCSLLKDVYIAAKSIDPDCKILNGGLSQGIDSVRNLYANGAKGYFDILNIHIFQSPTIAGAINQVVAFPQMAYRVMQQNGDGDKLIWITEIGCPGVDRGLSVPNWWLCTNPNETEQAAWVRYVYQELLINPHIGKVFWAFFRDCDKHWNDGIDYFGLVRWDFSKKPSFYAYQDAVAHWRENPVKKGDTYGRR